jgi:chromosome segregation ATPase
VDRQLSEANAERENAAATLARANKEITEMTAKAKAKLAQDRESAGNRREELVRERASLENWREQLESWRAQLDEERSALDARRVTLHEERSAVAADRGELAEESRLLEADAAAFLEEAELDADQMLERAWDEVQRLVGDAELDADPEHRLAELRRSVQHRETELAQRSAALSKREADLARREADLESTLATDDASGVHDVLDTESTLDAPPEAPEPLLDDEDETSEPMGSVTVVDFTLDDDEDMESNDTEDSND